MSRAALESAWDRTSTVIAYMVSELSAVRGESRAVSAADFNPFARDRDDDAHDAANPEAARAALRSMFRLIADDHARRTGARA